MTDHVATEDRFFRNPMWPYTEYRGIIYEPGKVARIKLNRPRYLNAQSHAMFGELEDAYDRASEDPECHVIVISGEGRCWSSGDDANGLTPESAPCLVTYETRDELLERYDSESALWHAYNIEHDYYITWWMPQKLLRVPKPTIAMVHGYCMYGAFAHAVNCDIIFASEDAMFLGGGASGRSGWDLGPRKGLELAYENRYMPAEEAYEYRLVNRVFPDREILERETLAFANRVANEVPSALKRIKAGYLNTLDHQGYRAAFDSTRSPFNDTWRTWAKDGQPHRFEGRGIARTPVSYYNLTQKLLGEGKEVPEHIIEALQRAVVRDDKGAWEKALHQEGREPERVARADAAAKAWEERLAREGKRDIKDLISDLLEQQEWVR
jgi:enoyl-CoA hydratase